MRSKFFSALAILVGTSVGAGFLGIPYIVSQSGFLPGLVFLLFVAVLMFFVQLYLGEVILRTKGSHQLAGYAEIYLGKWAKSLMFFSMIFGIYSALVAYLIGEGQTLSYIFSGTIDNFIYFSLGFWVLMSFLSYIGLRALKKYNKIVMFIVLAFVCLIVLFFSSGIKLQNLTYLESGSFFLPFGVILFSFLAYSAMPEVERVLAGQEKLMKKVISYGVIVPFLVYLSFTLIVVGCFGRNVPEIAVFSLGRFFSLLAVLTMFTAFFTLSIAIRDMFRFDFNQGRFRGWLLSCFIPLILFLLIYFFKIFSFIQLLSMAGIVSGGITGILVLLMNRKAKVLGDRKPEYSLAINWGVIALFSLIFLLAIILELSA